MKIKQKKDRRKEVNIYNSFPKIVKILIALLLISVGNVFSNTDVSQQRPTHVVSGIIKDNTGEIVIGANISVTGTKTGTVSNADGRYQITVPADGSLTVSYLGYKEVTIPVKNRSSIDIVMEEDTKSLDEVVVVGYGTQRKATLTGAVSSVKGTEIAMSRNENVQNMLTGRLPGLRVWQRSSSPGAYDNRMDIRGLGTPLIVIDGVPRTEAELQRLSPTDIEDISILKDGSAAIYGIRSANGVVLVTTRKGEKSEKPKVSYTGSVSNQYPSGMPQVVDPAGYMTLKNYERQRNFVPQTPMYSDQDFADYQNGTKVGWNWNDYMFKKIVPETQHSLSISGGNDRTTYYFGAGYFYQDNFFSTSDRNYSRYNLTSNITTKLSDDITFGLMLSSITDERNLPNESDVWTIRDYWRMNPLYDQGPWADRAETMVNANVTEKENPFTMLHSDWIGFQKRNKRWFDGNASLKWDIPYIKGLSIKGMFGYNYNFETYRQYKKQFYQYTYNANSDTYTQSLYPRDNIPTSNNQQFIKTQMLSQFLLNYNKKFQQNSVDLTLIWESQWRKGDNFQAQSQLVFPIPYLAGSGTVNQQAMMDISQQQFYQKNNNALAGSFKYGYADKYLAEFLFRYDGSSMFAPGHQWGFFPGASVAWRISEENFIKESSLSFINQLKLRTSYAQTGDDNASQYQFMSGYNYPTNPTDMRRFAGGFVFNGIYYYSVDNKGFPNTLISWYKSKMFNIALDFEGWKGLFGFTLDYFDRDRTGLLTQRNGGIPTVVGAALPQENLNSDRNYGLELTLTHRHQIGDFNYKVTLWGSVARIKRLYVEERAFGSSWDRWLNSQTNRLQGVYRGFDYLGQFASWNEIWNYPIQQNAREVLPSYYKFGDWNGDGQINDQDIHPFRFAGETPLMNYSLNFESKYKRFDFQFMLQGAAGGSLQYGEQMRGESKTLQMFLNQWHPVNFTDDPYNPNTQWVQGYYSFNADGRRDNSGVNVADITYLRLRNIELGYTLPKFRAMSARIFASGMNLYTLTKVRNVDPEHPGINDSWGFMYPLNKTLTLGLTLNF